MLKLFIEWESIWQERGSIEREHMFALSLFCHRLFAYGNIYGQGEMFRRISRGIEFFC